MANDLTMRIVHEDTGKVLETWLNCIYPPREGEYIRVPCMDGDKYKVESLTWYWKATLFVDVTVSTLPPGRV